MGKINLYDKFFHSPNWDQFHRDDSLEKFRSILKSGYILSAEKSGVKSHWECKHDRVYFGVHPEGKYRDLFAKGYSVDGYSMATQGFYFILNAKLCKDYNVKPGWCKFECTVPDEVDLYKYLVGIGNAGLSINDKFVICYYLIKYFNGEISIPELVSIVRERDFRSDLANAVVGYINACFTPSYGYLDELLLDGAKSLIDVGSYYDIVKILDEEGKKIRLYDNYGYSLNPEKRKLDVQNMLAYISEYKESTYEKRFIECMRDLYDSVYEKKY